MNALSDFFFVLDGLINRRDRHRHRNMSMPYTNTTDECKGEGNIKIEKMRNFLGEK